jgi:hypothetical protein
VAGDPPAGSTCIGSGCHGGTLNSHTAVLSINAPARYVPGVAYNITVSLAGAQSSVNGFELIARRPVSAYDRAGSLAAANAANVQVDTSGYAMHTLAGTALTSWVAAWTAPAAGFGSVRFYAAGNASNDSRTADSGDWIETATANAVENLAPTAPARNAPADAGVVATAAPQLSVNPASDGNGDTLTYFFQVCADAACGTVLENSPAVAGGGATVAWTPAAPGAENQRVYWRCRAYDGWVYGPYMAAASYWVDAVSEAPAAPVLQQPVTGATVYTATPLVVVSLASDPDPFDLVDYEFTLASDAGFTSLVTFATHVHSSGGRASWQVPASSPLSGGATYYLLVQAVDLLGNRSAAAYASLTVDLTHAPPATPWSLTPSGVTVATGTPTLAAQGVTGSGTLTYDFDLDVAGAFTPALRAAAALTAPTWPLAPPALADGPYRWRVRAFDGVAHGDFAYASFVVNAVNDPPGAPSPLVPLDGAQVNTRTPALEAAVAADPEGDALVYRFEIATDSGFAVLVRTSAAVAPATGGTVTWIAPSLANDTSYYWRVRAQDAAVSSLAGPYSTGFQLRVVNANLPPAAPVLHDATHDVGAPVVFAAPPPADPDGDPLTLRYEVYADARLAVPVTAASGVAAGAAWTPEVAWTPGSYYWRARAADAGAAGPWSGTAKLTLTGPLPWTRRDLPPETRPQGGGGGCAAAGDTGAAAGLLGLAVLVALRGRRGFAAATVLAALLAACGEETPATETVPARADWAAVRRVFDQAYCAGCHGGPGPSGGLSLEGRDGEGLVGVEPRDPVARERRWLRVTPGKPEASFLMYKVTTPPLGAGDRMPPRGAPLSAAQVEVIRRWIADGAVVP